ncbi:TnpR [Mycobacteroides abscessus]|nr:TnpR [Mycobacteroides abscessus]
MSGGGVDLSMLQQLMADAGRDLFAGVFDEPTPEVGAVPERVRGFRVRVDLMYAKPPIWRRLVLPGDLVLDELHDVLQVAMGWQDGHLHKFGVGADRRTRAYFVTRFDLSEGDDGLVEDGVRLDQVVSGKGDRLFYDYDFGDGWEHVLVVEDVLDDPPSAPVCLAGKMACPPEDCGGLGGYEELAAWVRGRLLLPVRQLLHVPGLAVGGHTVPGGTDQTRVGTKQHTTGCTGHGAVRVGHRHRTLRTGDSH